MNTPDRARGRSTAEAGQMPEARDRAFYRSAWKVEKFLRVGLRCSCGHVEEESGPHEGRELLGRRDLLTSLVSRDDGAVALVGLCPKCGNTMEAFSPDYEAGREADKVEVVHGNILLNEGIAELWDIVCGLDAVNVVLFDNTNAQIGVGNSSTGESAAHTDLQGTATWKAMESGYPSRSSQAVSWRGVFGSSDANVAWEEVSVRNGATRDKNLNRKVTSLGTKASGTTWTLTLTITLS